MVFTREDAARAAQNIGIDFKKEAFQLEDLLNGMNTELARHGTKAGTADVTHDDPTMTAKLAVANLRVSPSYYSQRVGKSAWERSLARGVKHKGAKTEYKTVEFELEGFDDKEGTFSGYGAVFSNIDSGGDIIEPGAFTKTIAEGIGRVKILSGHNDSLLPIGIPTELREDAKGLFMSAKISDTTLGRDVKTLIHDGVLCELSIGYDPVVFDYDENGIRHLREVKLWEISVVTSAILSTQGRMISLHWAWRWLMWARHRTAQRFLWTKPLGGSALMCRFGIPASMSAKPRPSKKSKFKERTELDERYSGFYRA